MDGNLLFINWEIGLDKKQINLLNG